MKVSDLVEKFNLKIFSGERGLDKEVSGGYVSDLLSDVMGNALEGQVWITLQTHQNVIAIAALKDLSAVILVKEFVPDNEMIEHSNKEGIPVLGNGWDTFKIAGKLYHEIEQTK